MKEFFIRIKDAFLDSPAIAVIDVIAFAVVLYAVFAFLKKHGVSRLIKFVVITILLAVTFSSTLLNFRLMSRVATYGIIIIIGAILLLFPQEIRRGLWKLSSHKEASETYNVKYECSDEELHEAVDDIVRAALAMAKKDVGALIVIAPEEVPPHIIESGTKIDAIVSGGLIESIFINKSPLHDGAVVLRGNRIVAAGCFLPLTQNLDVDKELGTRHRAAIGVSENHNVLAIIVSEETGIISVAYRGHLNRYYDAAMLTETLEQIYGLRAVSYNNKKRRKR